MQPVIIGTAGHIDHGKTALVKALTGTDTDRLKEERERGITIELGYAFLTDAIAFIDVPGHERFIKNMVAGAATVDFAVLVVAADDGIMPQTREHFDILRLLGVTDGLVAITKCDLADSEWIDLVEEDIRGMVEGTFLEGRPAVRVDSLSGRGIDELTSAITALAGKKRDAAPGSIFRLPIDRVFSVKGFGTVVTGSALSGTVYLDDRLELLPHRRAVRVRGIESHGEAAEQARAGMRVALNLAQIAVDEIARGDVIATPDRLRPTFMLDVELHLLEASPVPLEQRQRIRLHVGTQEVMARAVILDRDHIDPGETGLVQLRLEAMTAVQRLDRFVIRRYSPQTTMGGGRILDANPKKHRKRHEDQILDSLEQLRDDRAGRLILSILKKERFLTFDELVAQSGLDAAIVDDEIGAACVDGRVQELTAKGKRHICSQSLFSAFQENVEDSLREFHDKHPLRPGAKRGEILNPFKGQLPDFLQKHFTDLLLSLSVIKTAGEDIIALETFEIALTKRQRRALEQIETGLQEGGFHPPGPSDLTEVVDLDEKGIRQLLQLLVETGKAVNMDGKIYFHFDTVAKGIELLRETFEKRETLSISEFRELMDTTRKFALPLLNHYDNTGVTVRREDVRVKGPKIG